MSPPRENDENDAPLCPECGPSCPLHGTLCPECSEPPTRFHKSGCEWRWRSRASSDAGRVATMKAWSAAHHDVPRGFTRGDDVDLNTVRVGRLVLAWGWES